MHVIKILAAIFLAAFLIFGGLISFMGMNMAPVINGIVSLIGIVAGILILISLGCCRHKCDSSCNHKDH